MKPLIKWAGGKSWLAPFLAPKIKRQLGPASWYIEPFAGAASMALAVQSKRAILTDACEELVNFYKEVTRSPNLVFTILNKLIDEIGVSKQAYYEIRSLKLLSTPHRAARFLYLNRTGFNGLYRVNKHGAFNVPCGDLKSPSFPTLEELAQLADTFNNWVVKHWDFGEAVIRAGAGDVIYADPPYHGTFDAYTKDGFSLDDQERLSRCLERAHERDAIIYCSNADTPEIRELYQWANVHNMSEQHLIAGGREAKKCVLITNQ